jgi:uncharacterized protein YdhG (YjbR/CyaY superfamily)
MTQLHDRAGGAVSTPETVDAYLSDLPAEVAERLSKVRAIITDRLDGGVELIRYGMPAVMLGPRHGIHFAAWKKHIGLYPVPVLDEPLESAVAPYRSSKDTVRFRHDRELPYELVGRICDAVVELRRQA